ncbi:hypothetical protein [Pseudomonas sp. PB3P13]
MKRLILLLTLGIVMIPHRMVCRASIWLHGSHSIHGQHRQEPVT